MAERIADANIVVANKSPMNESTMKDAKQVKMIRQLSTGYDNVDIEYCKNRGIHVANARNYSTAAVAQRYSCSGASLCWKTCRIMTIT